VQGIVYKRAVGVLKMFRGPARPDGVDLADSVRLCRSSSKKITAGAVN
jgi:hypothetical protein